MMISAVTEHDGLIIMTAFTTIVTPIVGVLVYWVKKIVDSRFIEARSEMDKNAHNNSVDHQNTMALIEELRRENAAQGLAIKMMIGGQLNTGGSDAS
jgi:hypothetical protein